MWKMNKLCLTLNLLNSVACNVWSNCADFLIFFFIEQLLINHFRKSAHPAHLQSCSGVMLYKNEQDV